MPTIDEILAAMPEPTAEGDHEYLVIDPATRSITVPEAEQIFGVTGDEIADRKYFICPRIVGDGLDLAGMFIRVNFRNANGEEDGYLVKDVAVSGEYVTFSWQLSAKVAAYKGAVQFGICADLPNTADRRMPDWNTTMASGEVLEGLDPDDGNVEEETSDVVTQLRAETAAQTGRVQEVGAAQVQAVRAAAITATAEAQAQIEAKGAATLATIPADYTTMAGKVNEFANAIKGSLSGEIVQAGDVSPVEHYLGVKARSKNLFNTGKFKPVEDQTANIYVSAVGAGAITLYCSADHNGYYSTGLHLREVCSGLEPGKTYTLNAVTEATGRNYLYLHGAGVTWWYGTPQKVTEQMLDSVIVLYSINSQTYGAASCTISNIQIEEGTVATEYTPYIDPAGVTVTRCGKNLWPVFVTDRTYANGSYTKVNDDGSILLHVAGDNIRFDYMLNLPAGTYTMSNGEHTTTEYKPYIILYEIDGATHYNRDTFTIEKPTACKLTVYAWNEYTGDFVFTPQLELGAAVTAYEPYNGATAMPDETGTVGGLPSLAPTMTLLSDTPGVVIDCKYNRDTNAVLAEVLERITALGG